MQLRKLIRLLSFIGVLALPLSLFGQGPYFKSIDLPNRYGDVNIHLTTQCRDGFIWLGTDRGLFRFDGIEFTHFTLPEDGEDNDVTAVHANTKDTVWVGYQSGQLAFLAGGRLQMFSPPEGNPQKAITGINHDRKGNIWYSTYGEGIYVYNGSRVYNLDREDGLSDDFVYCLEPSPDGSIWAGTDNGINICTFDSSGKSISILGVEQGLPDNIVTTLQMAGDSLMYAGMHKEGLCAVSVDGQKVTPLFQKGEWTYGKVKSFTLHNHELWVATEKRQLVQYVMRKPSYIRLYGQENGLALEGFSHTAKDDEGNLWIAGKNSGLVKVNLLFEIIDFHEELHFRNIHALLADRKGNIWFFNDDALIRHNIEFTGRNSARIYPLPLPDKMQVISLYEDKDGYVWAGTFGDGVYRIDPATGEFRRIAKEQGLVDDNILDISGNGSSIWLATLGGVSRLPFDSFLPSGALHFETLGESSGLGNNYVYSLHTDRQGNLWFATDGNGLVRYSEGNYTEYSAKSGHIESSVVYSITEDAGGNIWFSTLKEGIYRFDGKNFEHYNTENGLSELSVTSLVADKKGHLIIAHNNGVDVLNLHSGAFSYYSEEYGLDDINPDLNTASIDVNGDIWFGTSKALIKYMLPGPGVRKQPHIVLQEPTIYLKPFDFTRNRTLSSSQNHLTFSYRGLWFQNPEAITYQYKLEGYDPDWVTTKDNSVIYPNLTQGAYRFSVRSSANNSFADAEIASFEFRIRAPFWKSWWFILIAVSLLLTALYLYIRIREGNLKRRERSERERVLLEFENLKSQVNPHFLFNSFNSLINVIEEDQEKAVVYVEKLSQFFRNILTYRDQELITLKEELKVVEDYFFINQQRYGSLVTLDVEVGEAQYDKLIPPLTLQILIENAIKHNIISQSSPLTISVRSEGDTVSVSNRLALKRTRSDSTGTGLENVRNRYRLLTKRPLEILNGPEYFTVRVPLLNRPL